MRSISVFVYPVYIQCGRIIKLPDAKNVNIKGIKNGNLNGGTKITRRNKLNKNFSKSQYPCGFLAFLLYLYIYSVERDNQTTRCKECRKKHWNKYNAMKQREYYKKKKSV